MVTIDFSTYKVYLVYGVGAVIFFILVWPSRFATHYDQIEHDEIIKILVQQTTPNITKLFQGEGAADCDYTKIIERNEYMITAENTREIRNPVEILMGGEYYPIDCLPLFSSAIIVEYRNRTEQLEKFLIYMHNFLRQQRIHYRIFVIEQGNEKLFNRAKLFNIGTVIAMKYGYPCLILHDVDLLPMNLGNIYACPERPRHMSSSLEQFRFNLPYSTLFGGATAINLNQFKSINGMSNLYDGWGGEDDDFYERLKAKEINICRFEPEYSRYTMMKHKHERPSENRQALLDSEKEHSDRYKTDGLSSLVYSQRKFNLKPLYTHAVVDF